MNYYRSEITGKILSDVSLGTFYNVYGRGADNIVDSSIKGYVLKQIDPPEVIECVKHGCGATAVIRYREVHPECSLKEARKAVRLMKKDLIRFGKDKKSGK